MRLTPLGEELIILEDLGDLAPAILAERLESLHLPGVVEAAPAWNSVGLHLDQSCFSLPKLESALAGLSGAVSVESKGKEIRIPVCWEMGDDLHQASLACDLAPESLIQRLESEPWPCRFIGFQPGFPYCGPLPAPLDRIPRRQSPRTRVPAGSVAAAAGQIGIYPAESPGGWMLLGRTPLVICGWPDPHFPIRPGDEISFFSISAHEFEDRLGEKL